MITVERAPLSLSVTAQGKIADGTPAEVAYSVDDAAYPAPYSGDITLTYFRESAGVRTQLEAAPIEAGSYVVVATAVGDRNYNAAVAEASFTIQASSDPDNPDNPDNPDKPDTKPTPSNNPGGKNDGTSAPRTSDNVVIWPLIVIAALGFTVFACSAHRVRMKSRRDDGKGLTG